MGLDKDLQTYRIEVRYDFTGSQAEAITSARQAANLIEGEVTAIFDEDWKELKDF